MVSLVGKAELSPAHIWIWRQAKIIQVSVQKEVNKKLILITEL